MTRSSKRAYFPVSSRPTAHRRQLLALHQQVGRPDAARAPARPARLLSDAASEAVSSARAALNHDAGVALLLVSVVDHHPHPLVERRRGARPVGLPQVEDVDHLGHPHLTQPPPGLVVIIAITLALGGSRPRARGPWAGSRRPRDGWRRAPRRRAPTPGSPSGAGSEAPSGAAARARAASSRPSP